MTQTTTRTSKPRTGATGWTGWKRRGPGHPWHAVCRSEDLGECRRQLLTVANGRSSDRFITRGGAYPRGG
jgi:hypothetical protein